DTFRYKSGDTHFRYVKRVRVVESSVCRKRINTESRSFSVRGLSIHATPGGRKVEDIFHTQFGVDDDDVRDGTRLVGLNTVYTPV
ncbi:hypothetical protein QTP70_015442, partial [Hemibagrus guttatus]